MTLRNRVTPFNVLVADPLYRGMFMGNRGRLHDDERTVVRWRNGKRWIVCLTEYKGRRRVPMTPGLYTELFFFDEAVALAVGHRPCAECRRTRFNEFRNAIVAVDGALMSADQLDAQLDLERRSGNAQRRHVVAGPDVPDGAMVVIDDAAYLVEQGELLEWSPTGYRATGPLPVGELEMLTPPLTARALRGGFRPAIHPSASTCL